MSDYRVSEELLTTITEPDEAYRQFPYDDGFGNWTVAYGHLIEPGEDFSQGIGQPDAVTLLRTDMAKAAAIVQREVTVPLDQGEIDALADAVFNMGDFLKASTLLKLLNAGDPAGAEQQLQRWDFAGGKPNAALHGRRIAEMALWSEGDAG
jgi:lysozyme